LRTSEGEKIIANVWVRNNWNVKYDNSSSGNEIHSCMLDARDACKKKCNTVDKFPSNNSGTKQYMPAWKWTRIRIQAHSFAESCNTLNLRSHIGLWTTSLIRANASLLRADGKQMQPSTVLRLSAELRHTFQTLQLASGVEITVYVIATMQWPTWTAGCWRVQLMRWESASSWRKTGTVSSIPVISNSVLEGANSPNGFNALGPSVHLGIHYYL
jgi:hypothetical protein